jgi:2-polyprenyl-3-methyl-5-hydroxy-6-metoxy-1,4-benzoquinol methylase
MSGYQDLAPYYDELFQLSAGEKRLMDQAGLNPDSQVLDIGCGTGNLTAYLLTKTEFVTAIDPDPDMIRYARSKPELASVRFSDNGMMDLNTLFEPETFTHLFAMGNTLVHLRDEDELTGFARSSSVILKPEGILLIQILNYDRILAEGVRELPLIETPELLFRRSYEPSDGRLLFKREITVRKTGSKISGESLLNPFKAADLSRIFSPYFKTIEFYGSFEGSPYSDKSDLCIFRLLKGLRQLN